MTHGIVHLLNFIGKQTEVDCAPPIRLVRAVDCRSSPWLTSTGMLDDATIALADTNGSRGALTRNSCLPLSIPLSSSSFRSIPREFLRLQRGKSSIIELIAREERNDDVENQSNFRKKFVHIRADAPRLLGVSSSSVFFGRFFFLSLHLYNAYRRSRGQSILKVNSLKGCGEA